MRSGMIVCVAPCERLNALHANRRRARAFDLRAHLDQQLGEVGDFRLAARNFRGRVSPSASTAAVRMFSVPVTVIFGKRNVRAAQPLGARLHVTVLDRNLRAHLLRAP